MVRDENGSRGPERPATHLTDYFREILGVNRTHRRWAIALAIATALLAGAPHAQAQEAPGPDDPALTPYYAGNALYTRQLYTHAITQYEIFLKASPKHAKAPLGKWGLALSYHSRFYTYDAAKQAKNRDDLKKAAGLFGELAGLKAIKEQEQLHNLWGACSLELDDFQKAETAWTWTVKNGKSPELKLDAMAGLAQALFLQDKWAETVKVTDELLKAAAKSPHAPEARYQGGVARCKLKQFAEADGILAALVEATKEPSLKHRSTYYLAECRWQAKKLDDAAALYTAAAKKDRGIYTEHALYSLGVVQFSRKQYPAAITELTAFLKQYPKSTSVSRAKLYLGRAYLETGEHADAEAALKPLLPVEAVADHATLWLARTYTRQQKHADVEALLTPAVTKFAKSAVLPELHYELATAQMNLGKHKAAAASYGSAITGGKGALAVESLRLQAFCLHRDGQYHASLKLCAEFVAAHPKHAEIGEVLFTQAENLTLLKRAGEASPIYEKVLVASPKHKRSRLSMLRLAQTNYQKQNWKECLARLDPLLKAADDDKAFNQIWYMAAASHMRLGAWNKAIPAFEKFIKEKAKEPNVDVAMYNVALAYQRTEQPARAMAVLTRLVKSHPKSKQLQLAFVELGHLQYEAEQYDEAKKTLLKVKEGGSPEAQYYLGWIALKQKEDADAARYFAAMAKHPKHPFAADAALQHAILQIRAKQYKDAEATLTGLLTNYPKYAEKDQAIFYKGLSLARQNLHAKAVAEFANVLAAYPKSDKADKALYWQAWCQRSTKNTAAAAKLYASFLQKFPKSVLAGDVVVELSELEFDAQRKLDVVAKKIDAKGKAVYAGIAKRLDGLLGPKMTQLGDSTLRNRALYLLGWCRTKLSENGKAAVAFETMLASKHKGDLVPSALFQAGEARKNLREHGLALKHFTAAVAAGKTSAHEPALLRRTECEALVAKWPESQKSAELFLKTYPKSAHQLEARFQLGWALENQKEYAEAIATYQMVVKAGKVNEISARSQFHIGECLFEMKKYEEAIPAFILVETRYGYPKYSSSALLELGRVLQEQGKVAKAAARYKEVTTRFPKMPAAASAQNLLKKLAENK